MLTNTFLDLNASADVKDGLTILQDLLDSFLAKSIEFIISLAVAFVIFLIGKKLIKVLLRFTEKIFDKWKVETSVSKFLLSLIKTVTYVILLLIVAETLGFKTSSLVALVGTTGLTIGLALQGSLSNFSGGVLILLLKPFRIGDYIIVDNFEGTVEKIDIFYTKLLTFDNRVVVLPNGTLSNMNITNVTNESIRRLDLLIPIEYSEDISRVKELLMNLTRNHELVLKHYDVSVFVNNFDPSSISIGVRVWCNTENYFPLKWDLLENVKKIFDENNIKIPFNQLDVNVKYEENSKK